jgi:hypothetical protein
VRLSLVTGSVSTSGWRGQFIEFVESIEFIEFAETGDTIETVGDSWRYRGDGRWFDG